MAIHFGSTTVAGIQALRLANDRVEAIVIPELGGRVWELTDRVHNRQWVWHRSGTPLARSDIEASYDDVWAGGWEELFPNDAAGEFEGRFLTDHGEWWRTAWTVSEAGRAGDEIVIRLAAEMRIRPVVCRKEIRLRDGSDRLNVAYRIENPSESSFHFLFKQHLPIAISEACRLRLPGGIVTAVDPSFGTLLPGPGPFAWPAPVVSNAQIADLTSFPRPTATAREFVYVEEIPDGWCRIEDGLAGAQLEFEWDRETLPYLWMFLAYGGWRDCYTAVIEPCTNMPKDLASAVRSGRSARFEPHGTFETAVSVRLCDLESPPA